MLYHASAFKPPSSPAYWFCWRSGKKTFPLDASIPTAAQHDTPEQGCYRCWWPLQEPAKSALGTHPRGANYILVLLPFSVHDGTTAPIPQLGLVWKTEGFPPVTTLLNLRFNGIMRSGENKVLVWTSISWMIQTISVPGPCVLGSKCTQAHQAVLHREKAKRRMSFSHQLSPCSSWEIYQHSSPLWTLITV